MGGLRIQKDPPISMKNIAVKYTGSSALQRELIEATAAPQETPDRAGYGRYEGETQATSVSERGKEKGKRIPSSGVIAASRGAIGAPGRLRAREGSP